MNKHFTLVKPQKISIVYTLLVAVTAYLSSQLSPYVGYLLALLTMIVIGFASGSIWPTVKKPEKPLVFSLFWGLIIGLLIPYLITKNM